MGRCAWKFFNEIKKIKDELELLIPDQEGNFELGPDASAIGIGAVLRQDERPLHIFPAILRKKKEAMVFAGKKW